MTSDLIYDGQPNLNAGIWPFVYKSFVAGHVTIVADPINPTARKVMKFAIADTDRPYSGATNPRADFETAGYFTNGSDLYYSDTFLIPATFPKLTSAGWFQINEVYGPPHGGSPPVQISLVPGLNGRASIALSRDKAHNYDRPWHGPALDAGWHTVTVHVKCSTNNAGFVEVYFDGVLQRFSNGSTWLYYTTLVSGVNWDGRTPNFLNINSYRKAYAYPGVVTLYHAGARIGKTLAAVLP